MDKPLLVSLLPYPRLVHLMVLVLDTRYFFQKDGKGFSRDKHLPDMPFLKLTDFLYARRQPNLPCDSILPCTPQSGALPG